MPKSLVRLIVFVAVGISGIACQQEPGNRKPTFPVIGKVLVDGEPVAQLAIRCFNAAGMDKDNPSVSQCYTQDDGTFKISTYEQGDGVPAGDYVLTFQWGQLNLFTKSYDGDKLNGRYSDPEKSEVTFTVEKGEGIDLGDIELTTK